MDDDLVARLVEAEISLGLTLVGGALSTLRLGNMTEFERARCRAQEAYLRARAHVLELPEPLQQTYTIQLQALQAAIDKLPVPQKSEGTEPDALASKPILDSPG